MFNGFVQVQEKMASLGILVEENTETSLTLTRGNYYLISEVQIERQHFFFRR